MTFAVGVAVGMVATMGLAAIVGGVVLLASQPDSEDAFEQLVEALRVVPINRALGELMRRADLDDVQHVIVSRTPCMIAAVIECENATRADVLGDALMAELRASAHANRLALMGQSADDGDEAIH